MSLFWRLYILPALVCAVAGGVVAWATVHQSESPGVRLILIGLVVAVTLLMTAVALRAGIAPLKDLREAVEEATDRGGGPVRLYRDDEVGRLADSYNSLVARMERQHQESLHLALRAQEAERLRISRELHDEVGQSLTLSLRTVHKLQEGDLDPIQQEQLDAIEEALAGSLDSVRTISAQLRPDTLDDLGLVPAVRELLRRVDDTADLVVNSSLQRPAHPLPDELQIAVYRIAQESLTNVVRHADASVVTCVLRADADSLHLSIRDDGSGEAKPAGSGVRGMRERAAIIGGDLSIVSVPSHGTTVNLRVPLAMSGNHPTVRRDMG